MLNRFFIGPADWTSVILAVVPALLIAAVAARVIRHLAAIGLAGISGERLDVARPAIKGPLRIVSIVAFVVLFELLLFPALELAGLQPRLGLRLLPAADWLATSGVKILVIVVMAYVLVRATGLLVKRFETQATKGATLDAFERARRARTLGSVLSKFLTAFVAGIACLMILKEIGLDITPVLTGAGIAGLAIGFGAQALVRDCLAGFFMILEDQLREGDDAVINGTAGTVEELNLRTVVLRDIEGTVHVFPNGAITALANRSKDYSYFVIDLAVSYREDPDRVAAIMKEVGEALRQDPAFAALILEPMEMLGVDAFKEWAVTVKGRIKTAPRRQWDVGREFRRRLKKALAEHGVELPIPERFAQPEHRRAPDPAAPVPPAPPPPRETG